MLDDILLVLPPPLGISRTALVRRLVGASRRVGRRLTALAFRPRARRADRELAAAEMDRLATQQGLYDEEIREILREVSAAAGDGEEHFQLVEEEPEDMADRVSILSRRYPCAAMCIGEDLQAEFDLLSMILYVAGRPVLALPAAAQRPTGRLDRVVVGWNGAPQSGRAAEFARRAFDSTVRIDIVSVQAEPISSEKLPAGDAGARRGPGAPASHVLRPARGGAIAPAIEEYVIESRADILVIGAPSRRSRMDFNVDSVASQLLRTANIPVVVSP